MTDPIRHGWRPLPLSDFEIGFLAGLAAGDGSFSVTRGRPLFQVRMTVRHGPLLRWVLRRLPGARLHGPYDAQGVGDERVYTLVMSGPALRDVLVPVMNASRLKEIDPHVYRRFAAMRAACIAIDAKSGRETLESPAIPTRYENPMTEKRREALARQFDLPGTAVEQMGSLLGALEAERDPPTTLRSATRAVDGHLADSLVGLRIRALRDARTIADLGAGAGFPGLALSVALPDAEVDLIESQGRKCEVIERLAASAGLRNARVVRARAEDWGRGEGRCAYDGVTARALSSLPVVLEYAAPLLREGGVVVAWRGKRDPREEESGDVAARELGLDLVEVKAVYPYPEARDRHLHVYRKVAPTPPRYPRRPGIAAKRPIA